MSPRLPAARQLHRRAKHRHNDTLEELPGPGQGFLARMPLSLVVTLMREGVGRIDAAIGIST